MPEALDGIFMKARCEHISVLDFAQGVGHREQLTMDGDGVVNKLVP